MTDEPLAVDVLDLPVGQKLGLREVPAEYAQELLADPKPPLIALIYQGVSLSTRQLVMGGLILDPQGLGYMAGQVRAAIDRLGGSAVAAFSAGSDQGYACEREQRHGGW